MVRSVRRAIQIPSAVHSALEYQRWAVRSQLRGEGRSILYISHKLEEIRSLCDRCVVMNGGAKIAEGTPQEALTDKEVIRAYLGEHHA